MSVYVTIATKITDQNRLLQALADLGFTQVECHEQAQSLIDYQGRQREQTAEIIIRRKHLKPDSNDIGFKQQGDGTYTVVVSDFDKAVFPGVFDAKVMQRYARQIVMRQLDQKRFNVVEETVDGDRCIRLVARRIG